MYEKILEHAGHNIEVVTYADGEEVVVECVECYVILVSCEKGD